MDRTGAFSGRIFKIIIDIIILILGIVLIAMPNQSLAAITIVIGIVLIGYGAISIIISIVRRMHAGILLPIICAAVGIILLVFNQLFANTVLPFIIGLWMLIMGIINFGVARRASLSVANVILSLVAVVLGIIILIGVFVGHNTFSTMLGVSMLIYGVASIINTISMGRNVY